ncbi:MAG: (2Fe-2S)-binding protein [Cyclobacteriaceae bacterium]|nr:(2Fe-2S)-binding protein [Cyclobacteriaceae bacterium]
MIQFRINGKIIETVEGKTILEAASAAGIKIPAMCFLEDQDHFPSCMICVVHNAAERKLLPSCSTRAEASMDIYTDDEEVLEARKTALELLLSDHVGDCEAPCQTNCPAYMDIPLMNRLLVAGKINEALQIVKRDIALPAVLGRICPAPCERACRRRDVDESVSICHLKRYAADFDLSQPTPFQPGIARPNGRSIAIIGTGPAGLSAAYFLIQKGYRCVLYDKDPLPGGALRYAVPDERLDKKVLDQEIGIIRKMGAEFIMQHEIKEDALPGLQAVFDCIIIGTGESDAGFIGLQKRSRSFITERNTHQTSLPGIFAIGSAIKPGRVAVRAVAHGKEAAYSVDQFLNNEVVRGENRMFNSRFGRLTSDEIPEYRAESVNGPRIITENLQGFSPEEMQKEAARCMHCDCRKKDICKLRIYSENYGAVQKRYFPAERKPVRKIFKNKPVVYEPEKCIKCGICVRITSKYKEKLGLTFIGKGFDVEVGVPFDQADLNALEKTAALCAENCPTGALALKENDND